MRLPALMNDMLGLLYPRLCSGCGNELPLTTQPLCSFCFADLPRTGFAPFADNPVERIFIGRLRIHAAHSEFYFTRHRVIRNLIHRLKYKGDKDAGIFLGRLLGESLAESGRFGNIDAIIPLPLYPDRERKRGYNQAEMIARGMEEILPSEILTGVLKRQRNTQTQTRKHRTERWENVREGFLVKHPELIAGKHILLVDDVVTTGASLEACGATILDVPGTMLSMASAAMAS